MPGYETKVQSIAIAEQPNLIVRSLKDLQQYDDPDCEAAHAGISSATWPLFGHLWPSGRILAAHLSTVDIAGRRVLELGCGLAFASLMMHRAGEDVTATDIHPEAGQFILANIALNLMRPLSFYRADWAVPDGGLGQFGLLVGSDLLYERSHASDLSGFIARHAHADAEVIMVDPNRGHRAEFRRLMFAQSFAATVIAAPETVFDGVAYRGQIISFRRR